MDMMIPHLDSGNILFIFFHPNTAAMVSKRIQSVDLLRGLVMVLMAIDHVRVYSGMPAGGPEAGIFFTRWITHFCAPAFVFFAGTSAFLHAQKLNDKTALAKFLVTRGLLLVFLELTLIRFCWTFNLDYASFTLAGVIWMLGWCMVLLALFVRLQTSTIGIIGLIMILVQQVFHIIPGALPESAKKPVGFVWEFFYPADLPQMPGISILYVLIPWIGVMMAGYAFGSILKREAAERNRICLRIGLSAIILFLIVAGAIGLNSRHEDEPPFYMRLLNQNKYPPSQLYLLMTLGPLIALVPFAERAKGWLANVLTVFGRVPMFYYLAHIPLIHLAAFAVNWIRDKNIHQDWYNSAPFVSVPPEERWGLPLLYLVFLIVVVILYFICRWYSKYKAANPGKKWLQYI
jgi:uncharacterized membrane protein